MHARHPGDGNQACNRHTRHTTVVATAHILYNISTTLYSLQLYSISTVYNLYNTPLAEHFD